MGSMMGPIQWIASAASGAMGRDSWLIRQLRPTYESTLQLMSAGRGVPWKINGVPFRVDPHYRNRMSHNYDAPVAIFLSQRVKPGAICFDVGANVGVYVLQFAHWAGSSGRVVAFEPNPAAVEILSRHLRLNKIEGMVTIEKVAIGGAAGTATLYRAEADGMSRLGEPNKLLRGRVEHIEVPVTTIDEFCTRTGLTPDWLLIDIEGFEFAALVGATRMLKRQRNKLGLVVEMHPDVWNSAATSRADAERFLSEMGLRAIPLTGQREALGEYGLVHLSWA
jgi:FkbM family methyltransferase